ncbi:MAG TPA: DSD1 family PLP-dependent enzyme [Aliidongia sp.]|nr:DSD1 family PLP-dependent enzyme [Aliidongia sp.]
MHPNESLIGAADARRRLDTPALLIELGALDRNIARMAEFARAQGLALRPHAKTHKSDEIARRQIEAGAVGISCATLGEAEIMVAARIPGVLVTSPQVTESKVARLIALARAAGPDGLMVVIDHPDNLAALDRAAASLPHPLAVLVDCAAGLQRTGCATAEAALALARAAHAAPHLALRGIQHYSGNLQHIPVRSERAALAKAQRDGLAALVAQGRAEGLPLDIVSGAGTGTFDLDPEGGVFTELQTGSYIFMDVDYLKALADGRNEPPFETALLVQTSVVSTNAEKWVTTDGGLKCFATEGPRPSVLSGADTASRYEYFGDEHGMLVFAGAKPRLGDRVEVVTPHCDPTVNLHDFYHVMEGDKLVALWPVAARGKR